MKLEIEWRHVPEGRDSCQRCGDTKKALERVIDDLAEDLHDGLEIAFTQLVVPRDRLDESNQIRIGGIPIEDILDADVGTSACQGCGCAEDACGEGETADCRMLEIDGEVHEMIDEGLIHQALQRYLAVAGTPKFGLPVLEGGNSIACC